MTPRTSQTVLVTGDYVLDHHIYEGQREHFCDRRHRGVLEVEELGGAALVHYLLSELARGVASHLSVAVDGRRRPLLPPGQAVPSDLSAYAIWRPFGSGRDNAPNRRMWRTTDAMGFGCYPEKSAGFDWPSNPQKPASPSVVVLSDGGMGFRENELQWPDRRLLRRARWIVLKTAHPFAEGKLWERLSAPEYRKKLVVIVSSAELRKGAARISAGLSWDATVESVLTALAAGGACEAFTRCRHLLIAFGTEGGLWVDIDDGLPAARAHLVYDAAHVEGEHRDPEAKGTAFGALSCLAAAVAWRLALAPSGAPDLEAALEGGLSAMHDLLSRGHGPATASGQGFPAKRLAKVICDATCRYAKTVFPATAPLSSPACTVTTMTGRAGACWSLMYEVLRQEGVKCPEPAWDLAERVARHGPIALGSRPHLSIGKLISADRREIESLRELRQLILDYKMRLASECKKPLAIGVFGPPGAGKSFAVKEIARTLMGEKGWQEGWLEFNLAQFKSGSTVDLIGAFHQIRDRVLKALVPVAFFDEFDARSYEWLQYLLAPMQDGAFQEGQVTHPIGKSIFIFAGATSWTHESFGPPEENEVAYDKFRMAKGPDFKSRLDGFLDILGPNRRRLVVKTPDGQAYDRKTPDPCDVFFPVRRALVLRSELSCEFEERLDIDAGLLRALLHASDYHHGSRSLSKLIEPLKVGRPGPIRVSMLPSLQQIGLHVDGAEFLKNCAGTSRRRAVGTVSLPASVAEAIHETYRALGKAEHWLDARNDVGFKQLSCFYQDSNAAAAQRMPLVLGLIGLALRKGKAKPAEREAVRLKIEHNLELLAAEEHARWMAWYLDQGWQYGPVKPPTLLTEEPDPKKKTHPCLRPYLELSDEDRNKDRNAIRHYLDCAETAGMKIVAA